MKNKCKKEIAGLSIISYIDKDGKRITVAVVPASAAIIWQEIDVK